MLCAPLLTEAEGVWGIRAVRDLAVRMTAGVIGHVGIWAAEEEQLQAGMYVAVFVVFQAGFSAFVTFHYSPLPTRLLFFYHAGLCSLKGPQRTVGM